MLIEHGLGPCSKLISCQMCVGEKKKRYLFDENPAGQQILMTFKEMFVPGLCCDTTTLKQ